MNNADPYTTVDFKCSTWDEFNRLEKLESVLWDRHFPLGSAVDLHQTIPVAFGDIKYLLAEAKKFSRLKKVIQNLNCEDT